MSDDISSKSSSSSSGSNTSIYLDSLLLYLSRYFLYTKTRIGYFYHRREITKYAQEHPDGHSKCHATEFMGLMIIPVPMLKDNYAYIIIETQNRTTVVVDPGDAHAVQAALKKADVVPSAVLTTHKHCLTVNSEELLFSPLILYFAGHEYAVQNLKFAIHLNPDNEITRQKLNWASKQRKKMLPTCPSSLREEKLYNPFLRLSDKVILESLKMEQNEDDENNSHSFQVRVLNEMRERKEIYNQDV
ncbi:probable hydrolase PNKD [Octopus sinensis]|uniref:Probable hydrolase PNKD n=1 Tax=Octopus sinensis TaxID=2607531 RepID=A0A7E6FRS3_9MOLL|nr:probable hydrolase PNKD [Octopus sinensis]